MLKFFKKLSKNVFCRDCDQHSKTPMAWGNFKRFYHLHIRKTGGTSINHMFLGIDGSDGASNYVDLTKADRFQVTISSKVFVGWDKELIEKGAYFYAFSHLPLHQLRLPSKTMTITCFRDPVARLFSHYKMLREYQKNKTPHPCMAYEEVWLGSSFRDFIIRTPKDHALRQLFMFSSSYQIDEALHRALQVHHIFFTEQLSDGVESFNKKTGFEMRTSHTRCSQSNERITPLEHAMAREKLADEYEFLKQLKSALQKAQT